MEDEPLNPPPRVELGPDGRALWDSIATVYGMTPGDREILVQACKLADSIARLTAMIEEAEPDLMVPGNRPGTFVLHPAISERRMAIALQAMSIARLRLPIPPGDDEDDEDDYADYGTVTKLPRPMSRSEAGRKAANTRWSGRG